MEDGLQKQVVEQYVVDALSFAEAEQRITEEMSAYISGEFEVVDVKKAAYKEVFFDDDNAASDRWYKVKLDFITIDEKTEKEKFAEEYPEFVTIDKLSHKERRQERRAYDDGL